jgi:hypothetical protein
VFTSSGLAEQLGANGLRFLLARALVHGSLPQRLAALLPVLVLTVMFPETPWNAMVWLGSAGFIVCWLAIHWFFELRANHQAAQALGLGAEEGLREIMVANASPIGWLSVQPPVRWRLHVVTKLTA